MEIPNEIRELLERLNSQDGKTYIVGGSVRDSFFGMATLDYDFATTLLPTEVKGFLSDDIYKVNDYAIEYGSLEVEIKAAKEYNVQITTLRKEDEYKDLRHPSKIEFVKDVKTDGLRRDFTMNAVYYNGEYLDFFCGIEDIKNKRIKTVVDPKLSFNTDPLRILRGLRFCALLGFYMEENTKNAAFIKGELLNTLSKERKVQELLKLLSGDFAFEVISEYLDLFLICFPFINGESLKRNDFKDKDFKNKDIYGRLAVLCKGKEQEAKEFLPKKLMKLIKH